jgi:hypothetical protein
VPLPCAPVPAATEPEMLSTGAAGGTCCCSGGPGSALAAELLAKLATAKGGIVACSELWHPVTAQWAGIYCGPLWLQHLWERLIANWVHNQKRTSWSPALQCGASHASAFESKLQTTPADRSVLRGWGFLSQRTRAGIAASRAAAQTPAAIVTAGGVEVECVLLPAGLGASSSAPKGACCRGLQLRNYATVIMISAPEVLQQAWQHGFQLGYLYGIPSDLPRFLCQCASRDQLACMVLPHHSLVFQCWRRL